MLAILITLIIVGLYIYFLCSECESLSFTIFSSLLIAFFILALFLFLPAICGTDYETIVYYDSYSVSYDSLLFGVDVSYYHNDQLYHIHAADIDIFNGESKGHFVVVETRFDSPDWFWLIMFLPDNFLIRTEVLIV